MARVFTSYACLGHAPGLPEQPERLAAVLRRLRADPTLEVIEAEPGDRDLLTLVHPGPFIDQLEAAAASGLPGGEEVPLGAASWPAILGSAGAVAAAVASALDASRHAFAAVRPPGHHAEAARAMGFCPVNLVAMARALARRSGVERALIIDWDVHHGNGTQAIVESDPGTRFISMHQHPHYPWSGLAEERGVGNVFNVPLPPGLPRASYLEALWQAIEAATEGWHPELLLISAGYDCLAGDPLGGFTLEPEDAATWIHRLRERWPTIPLVGLMEGGYAPARLADGVHATVRAMAGP